MLTDTDIIQVAQRFGAACPQALPYVTPASATRLIALGEAQRTILAALPLDDRGFAGAEEYSPTVAVQLVALHAQAAEILRVDLARDPHPTPLVQQLLVDVTMYLEIVRESGVLTTWTHEREVPCP